jgi:hypothetical protein
MVKEEEAGSSDVDGCGGDRHEQHQRRRRREQQSRESSGDLESFGMKNEMTQGGLIFIGLKISEAVLNQNRC